MAIRRRHLIFGILGLILLGLDIFIFSTTPWFLPILVIAILIMFSQSIIDFLAKFQRKKEIEERFPDFIRNLVGAIKSGMPAPKAITHVAAENYGALTPYVTKLANQVEWAVALHKALKTFAVSTKSRVIIRSIETIIEAERAGGNIQNVLESVIDSVVKIKKIREKRRAEISTQILQTYIIFVIFLIVMIIIQNFLMPFVAGMSATQIPLGGEQEALIVADTEITELMKSIQIDFTTPYTFFRTITQWLMSLRGVFIAIVAIQGFFGGLVLGKLAEGDISAGIKHSLLLIILGVLVMTVSQGFIF